MSDMGHPGPFVRLRPVPPVLGGATPLGVPAPLRTYVRPPRAGFARARVEFPSMKFYEREAWGPAERRDSWRSDWPYEVRRQAWLASPGWVVYLCHDGWAPDSVYRVGHTGHAERRMDAYRSTEPWWFPTEEVEFLEFPDKALALSAEQALLWALRPTGNQRIPRWRPTWHIERVRPWLVEWQWAIDERDEGW